MKNILHVTSDLDRVNGISSTLMNILRHIDRTKYHFTFLIHDRNKKDDFEDEASALGAEIIKIKKPTLYNLPRSIKTIEQIITAHDIDIVHDHFYYHSTVSLYAATKKAVPMRILHSHSSPRNDGTLFGNIQDHIEKRFFYSKANTFLTVSRQAAKIFPPATKSIIIHNGVDTDIFAFSQKARTDVRKKLHIANDTRVFIHSGRFAKVKNHNFLLNVFAEYLKRDENAKLILVGTGELEKAIKQQIRSLAITNNTIILPPQPAAALTQYYSAADAMLLPSFYEGLPIVLLEAQCSNLKILSSRHVDKAAKISPNVDFLPIDNIAIWVDKMLQTQLGYPRPNRIKNTQFDIKNAAKELEVIYATATPKTKPKLPGELKS